MIENMKKLLYSMALTMALFMPFTAEASWSDYVIVLDPGHGGDDPGACYSGGTYSNQTESWLVLQCATNVYNKLTSLGAEVYMTRWEEDFSGEIDLSPRRAYCYTYGSDVFVSFHLNAANAVAYGTETWYYYSGSYDLASCVQNGLISKFTEQQGNGGFDVSNRGIKNNSWTVITAGESYPAVLTEGLFVDTYSDWQLIQDTTSEGFYSWVDGHLKGIYDYLNSYGYYSVTEPSYYNGGGGAVSTSPYISVSSNNVYFECEAGQTATATVLLEGNKLNGWCYVTPSDACNGIFTVTPTGLNVAGYPDYNFADENPQITITFTPSAVGTYSGDNNGDGYNDYVITLKSVDVDGNDVYQWINLNGTATAPPLSFTEKWNSSDKAGTLTQMGWDSSKVRNMAYYDGKLYLVYEQSYIKVVDARTGKFLYNLNSEGVEGGLINLCDVRPFDGKIVACNIAGVDGSGNKHDLKIYVWENAIDAPKVTTISYSTLEANEIVRLGDYIEVGGDWNMEGSRIIFGYDNYGKISGVTGGTYIVEFPVSNGTIGTTPSNKVQVLDNGSIVKAGSFVRAYPTNYGYLINGSNISAMKIDASGNVLDRMSGFKTWGNVYRQFDYDGTTYGMILDFTDAVYSSTSAEGYPEQTAEDLAKNYLGGHAKLLQISSEDWSFKFFSPKNMASYPAVGLSDTRQNLNCTGNIQLNQDAENYVEAWILSTNQGIAYYYTGNPPESVNTDPIITSSVSSLTFAADVDAIEQKTVNISSSNLAEMIAVEISGDDAEMWSVSPNNISASGTLTVTYSPTKEGNHSAIITLSSLGAPSITVSLTGNATVPQKIEGYELIQDWVHTSGHLAANSNSRWATGFGGKIYVNDHANSKLYYWSESGITDTGISSASGTAITSDDAGNIILPNSIYSSGCTSMKILPAGSDTFQAITITLPSDVTASTLQYMAKAIGNVMSDEGGAIYIFPSGSTKVAKIIIANGEQQSATSIDTPISSDGQSIAIALTSDINSDLIAVRNRLSDYKHFYTNLSGSFKALSNNGISTTQGGTIFSIAKKHFAVEPILNGTASNVAYLDGFQIVNIEENSVVATHQATLSEAVVKPNPNCITAEIVDNNTVKLYQYVPGQLAAQYTFNVSTTDGVADVRVSDSVLKISIEGNVLTVLGGDTETIDIYSISGVHVASFADTNEVNIGQLRQGFYIVTAKDSRGNVVSAKIVK